MVRPNSLAILSKIRPGADDSPEIYGRDLHFPQAGRRSNLPQFLAWETHAAIALWEVATRRWPTDYSIRRAVPSVSSFPRVPWHGLAVGYGIDRLPLIENETQRLALSLYREANAANNDFLAFLRYWQVLEVARGNAVALVDAAVSSGCVPQAARLPLGGKSLGAYLERDCRHAVAHISRPAGRPLLDVDNLGDRLRIAQSIGVARSLAEYHVRENLALQETAFLRTPNRGGVPAYHYDGRLIASSVAQTALP